MLEHICCFASWDGMIFKGLLDMFLISYIKKLKKFHNVNQLSLMLNKTHK